MSRVRIRCHIPGEAHLHFAFQRRSEAWCESTSRRSKMFLADMDVDVDTTDKVPIMVD